MSASLIGRFGVKRFQTIHQNSFEVAREHTLLVGIRHSRPLPAWDLKIRWNNLYRGLAVVIGRSKADMRTHLIHRPAMWTPYTTAWWSSQVSSYWHLIRHRCHAATAASRVHRNSVPSTQMRCMITASRRAKATIVFFIPAAPGDLHRPSSSAMTISSNAACSELLRRA